ncbi:MAG: hypothetical protein ACLUEQ_07490 [Cloacibacillus evryensis]
MESEGFVRRRRLLAFPTSEPTALSGDTAGADISAGKVFQAHTRLRGGR